MRFKFDKTFYIIILSFVWLGNGVYFSLNDFETHALYVDNVNQSPPEFPMTNRNFGPTILEPS
jgi:hypothetical protein